MIERVGAAVERIGPIVVGDKMVGLAIQRKLRTTYTVGRSGR
jgi:hypothetical protein